MFIVFEGLDGSGKSTQVKRLNEWFCEKNIPCLVTREPSDHRIGELTRAATHGAFPAESETLALLFAADRFQHYHGEIAPALKRGEYVLCDRYFYSNLVYQGTDSEAVERIYAYNQAVISAKTPDAVIFLDTPPEECMRRIIASRSEISIFETLEKLKNQRARYLKLFDGIVNLFTIETSGEDENTVFEKILNKINPLCSI